VQAWGPHRPRQRQGRWAATGFHNCAVVGDDRRRGAREANIHYFRGGNSTNVRDEAAAAANSGDVSTGGRVMGSLPHGVSLGISLSLGGNWCGQVHRERWRHGRWREAPLAYFSFYTFSQPKSWILRSLGGHTSLYRHSVCPASRPGGCRVEVVGGMQTGVRHCR